MVGPRDLSLAELQRCGLGLIQRRAPTAEPVIRAYCLRCGSQVASDRRDADPDGWWKCARECNTRWAETPPPEALEKKPRDGKRQTDGARSL